MIGDVSSFLGDLVSYWVGIVINGGNKLVVFAPSGAEFLIA